MNGGFLYEDGKLQLRRMSLNAGLLTAKGTLDMDAETALAGRFQVEIKSANIQSRGNLTVGGNLKEPRFTP
jgi:hypothetical protein